MKKTILIVPLILGLCFLTFNLCFAGAGTKGGEFLKIGVGERAIGMGGAFCSIADNVTAVYWNPAGLAQLKMRELSAMHLQYLVGVKSEYLGYAQPIGKGTLAGQISFLHSKSGRRDDKGNTIGEFWDYEGILTLGYGRWLNSVLSLGINLKTIYTRFDTDEASGIAFDIGCLYKTPIEGLGIGIVLQNIETGLRYTDQSESMALNLKIGTSYRFGRSLIFASDADTFGNKINFRFGSEYTYIPVLKWGLRIAARIGYKTATISDLGALSGLSAGMGLGWRAYGMDYAWVPYGDLGNTHRISLNVRF